jgi:hypothetical protein
MRLKVIGIALTCLSLNLNAACPAKLDGTYTITAIEYNNVTIFDQSTQTDKIVAGQVVHNIFTGKIVNNTLTLTKYWHAEPDNPVMDRTQDIKSKPELSLNVLNYNRADCTATNTSFPAFFVIKDNGNTIEGIKGGSDGDLATTFFKFSKQ